MVSNMKKIPLITPIVIMNITSITGSDVTEGNLSWEGSRQHNSDSSNLVKR